MTDLISQMFENKTQQAKQAYPEDIANFNLIPSKNKSSERAPDFFGSTKINGTWFMLSAWVIFSRTGSKMINTAMRPATAQEAQRQEAQQAQYASNAANNPQNGGGGQFGSQQGQYQGQPQQPATAFTGHAQQNSPQAQPQGAFGQPAQAPQGQAFTAPQGTEGVTAPWETAGQATSPNPLEEDAPEVVHVDLPSKPSF